MENPGMEVIPDWNGILVANCLWRTADGDASMRMIVPIRYTSVRIAYTGEDCTMCT